MIGYVTENDDVAEAQASDYGLSRPALEHEGRWRTFRRSGITALFLFALQVPLIATATGHLASEADVPAVVPARISLVVDLAMIAAYVLVAYRALELMWAVRCTRAIRRTAYAAAAAVGLGAALDLLEDLTLWVRVGDASAQAAMTTAWSWPMRVLVIGGVGVLFVIAVRSKRRLKKRSDASLHGAKPDAASPPSGRPGPHGAATEKVSTNGLPPHQVGETTDATRPNLVIACSGGGVRSASFCLGGLQVLNRSGHYRRADAVIGVSGGGYMAAAFHAARWWSSTDREDKETWSEAIGRDVFSQSSPEQHWLRRNTRYLLKSADVALQALLSLLYGMAVNIVLLTAVVLAIAWLLGWYLNASGALVGWDTPDAQALQFPPGWWSIVGYVWVVPLAGVVPFLLEKLTDRFHTLVYRHRQMLRRWTSALMVWGLVASIALLGVPVALAGLHDFTTGSGSAWAQLLQVLGFASQDACAAALETDGTACGVTTANQTATPSPVLFSAGSLAALVAAVLAVVRAATSPAEKSTTAAGSAWVTKVLGKLWHVTKHVVVPWLAVLVVVTVIVLVLLRVTAALVDTPTRLESWSLVYGFAAVLVFVRILTDANRTSMHHFYRERLSFAYLVRRRLGLVAPIKYQTPLRFSGSIPPEGRGPQLVACAVANISDSEIVPENRGCTPFVFDGSRIGLTDRILPTPAATVLSPLYEYAADRGYRDATIPAAMAMSGAAISPLVGRMNRRVAPYRLVLALANARLGVWLPNPLWVDDLVVVKRLVKARCPDDVVAAWPRLGAQQRDRLLDELLNQSDRDWLQRALDGKASGDKHSLTVTLRQHAEKVWNLASKPGPYRLMKEAIGRTSIYDRKLYITDGGHYDNLGLLEALRRKPREIIVLDASADVEDTFDALGSAVATARMDLDCEITFDPRTMKRVSSSERAVMAWGKGTYAYDGVTGDIWLAKVIMTDALPWDVESYAARNPTFPRTSTGNQLYGEFDLEAYRILGREVTQRMVRDVEAHAERATEDHPAVAEPSTAPVART